MRTYPGMMFNYLNYLIVNYYFLLNSRHVCQTGCHTLDISFYFQPSTGMITIQIMLIYMMPGYDLGKVAQNLLVVRYYKVVES